MENNTDCQPTWAPVRGYEGYYEASDCGAVRRIITQGGKPCEKLLRTGRRRGYANFTLSRLGDIRTYCAHRLIWEAFNGAIPDGMQINHLNGEKLDNRLANLEACTASENMTHAYSTLGHDPRRPQVGTKNGRAKLTEADVAKVRSLRSEGWSQQRIADLVGIHQTGVSALLRGLTWRTSP